MRLTRRDALAALGAAGVAGGAGAALLSGDGGGGESGGEDGPLSRTVETYVAAGVVLYPSEIDGVEPFVAEYVRARAESDEKRRAGFERAATYLEEYAEAWFEEGFAALAPGERDEALRRMSVDVADPDPAGSDVERVRYYVVNELLFALYASPTGGELLGIESPPGHPGGISSYRRGPQT